MTKASEARLKQFPVSGAPVVSCSCGRTHVAIESVDLDSRDRQHYTRLSDEGYSPVVLVRGVDYVDSVSVADKVLVVDCPCDTLARLERIVKDIRRQILGYYKATAEKAEAEALALRQSLGELEPL